MSEQTVSGRGDKRNWEEPGEERNPDGEGTGAVGEREQHKEQKQKHKRGETKAENARRERGRRWMSNGAAPGIGQRAGRTRVRKREKKSGDAGEPCMGDWRRARVSRHRKTSAPGLTDAMQNPKSQAALAYRHQGLGIPR